MGGVRRRQVDFGEVYRRLAGRCFICEMLRGNPEFRHRVVFEDGHTVAFLQRFQTLYGYVLVAPKERLDLSEEELDELAEQIRAEIDRR